jgi:hypothetical protein
VVDDDELQIVGRSVEQQHVLLNRKGSLTLYDLEVFVVKRYVLQSRQTT